MLNSNYNNYSNNRTKNSRLKEIQKLHHTKNNKKSNYSDIDKQEKAYVDSEINLILFNRLLMFFLCISLFSLSILYITSKNDISSDNRKLSNINSEIAKINNQNTNLKQEQDDLKSDDRLKKIAYNNNLSLNEDNIKTINKQK